MCSYRENENAEQIVSRHIKLLHKYNEAKDAAQVHISVDSRAWTGLMRCTAIDPYRKGEFDQNKV